VLDLKQLLRMVAESGGSDVHLKVGSPPIVRVDGLLRRLKGEPLTTEDTDFITHSIVPPDRREKLEYKNEADFALSLAGVGRFRVNVFRQRGSISLVLRRVRVGSASFEELGLPPIVRRLSEGQRGLVLVTGPSGAGKTTTLAAMIDHINATRPLHILTVEDPIEVLHPDRMATVNQREIGVDTDNYVDALRAAVRQDPDIILIGEMRDTETVQAALTAAETGHLVFSTLHTNDAVETVNRIVDFFPPFQQHQARVTLASVLQGVVGQRLIPKVGGGRIPALEVLVNNGRISDRIIDAEATPEIHEIISKGEFYGMQTFDQSLVHLVRQGLVSPEDALHSATRPHDLSLMLQQSGIVVPTQAMMPEPPQGAPPLPNGRTVAFQTIPTAPNGQPSAPLANR
jgi:twitching motility protein PilT